MKYQPLKTLTGIALAATFLTTAAVSANAAEFKVDPSHSFIEFKTKHLGYSWLPGRFNTIEGTMTYDPAAGPSSQKINLTIDTASIDTNHAERDKHLRSADFFDVEKYPTATFASTGYDGDANGGTLTGDLTLHGVTKSISFEIQKIGEGDDPWGGYRAGFSGSYTLVRKDFEMGYNLGPAAEEVELDLLIEAIRQ
ncbi:YceI family protein [Pelagibius sp. Alg239-R121]|uniref:YceI family protein n=1 Tax=Pelagibius sp. Alg239-R121 TaxID=2993448 RepID=UPI0024A6A298|nr:YceI family protein [Pelagibius sp. Alg239-R121]